MLVRVPFLRLILPSLRKMRRAVFARVMWLAGTDSTACATEHPGCCAMYLWRRCLMVTAEGMNSLSQRHARMSSNYFRAVIAVSALVVLAWQYVGNGQQEQRARDASPGAGADGVDGDG